MSDAVAILGQSNPANLWALSGISTLSSTLNALTGKSIGIIQGAVGGAPVLKAAANSSTPHNYWLDKDDSGSPLHAFLAQDLSSVKAIAWVGNEDDARIGASTFSIVQAMKELQAIIYEAMGREVPFILSPLGKATSCYTDGWKVRDAHLELAFNHGFVLGPQYIDLAVESDGIHLTAASRETFALRWAASLAPYFGGSGSLQTYSGSFTRDASLASGTQTVSGLPFTPAFVSFSAALSIYTSTGTDNGSTASCAYVDGATGGTRSDASIYTYAASSGNGYKGKVSAFGSGSFTVDWTKIATPGGTITVNYTATG